MSKKNAHPPQKSIEQYRSFGYKCRARKQFDKAENYYRQWIAQQPLDAEPYNLLGNTFREQWRLTEATQYYKQALAIHPRYAAVFNNLGNCLLEQGQTQQALGYYRAAVELEPNILHYQSLLLGLHYPSGLSAEQIFRPHLDWQKFFSPPRVAPTFQIKQGKKIRIGYVSGDFHQHSVNYFFEPILRHHDRDQFHITCYSNNAYQDTVTQRLKRLTNQWVDCHELNDKMLYSRIRRDQIDILVDLSGLTPMHRLGVFAQKPAPIQISGIGYVHTTGLTTMDYRLVDTYTDPQTYAQHYMVEQPLYLPHSYCCYDPLSTLPEQRDLPALNNGYITLASFNKLSKLSEACFETWCEILRAVPDSHLHLYNLSFQDKEIAAYWYARFEHQGIAKTRLEFSYLTSHAQVVNAHQATDLILDTFPYNGCTTTCQALSIGVPVLSLWGETHAARVGGSFLTSVGLTQLIADTTENYISTGIELAQNINSLQHLRGKTRQQMLASPLMQAEAYTRELETQYQRLINT